MKGEESKVSISPSACPRSHSVCQISDPISDAFFAFSSPVSVFTISHDYGLIHIKVEIIQNRDSGPNADRFFCFTCMHWRVGPRKPRRKERSVNRGRRVVDGGWRGGFQPFWNVNGHFSLRASTKLTREIHECILPSICAQNRSVISRIAGRVCGEGGPCGHRIQEGVSE